MRSLLLALSCTLALGVTQADAQPRTPTPLEIAQFLDISLPEARTWRAAWLEVVSPTATLPGATHAHVVRR